MRNYSKKFKSATQVAGIFSLFIICSGQTTKDKSLHDSFDTNNEKLVAVVISTIGPQRSFIAPILLYTDEKGLKLGRSGFSPYDGARIKSEQCEEHILIKLLTGSSAKLHWIKYAYGDTEIIFCRLDGKRHIVQMNKGDATDLVQPVKEKLGTNSLLLEYLSLINRDFPPATDNDLPPFKRKGSMTNDIK